MQFTCEKKELLKLVTIVTKAVAVKSINTMLEHIYIEAKDSCVIMKCTDLVLSIKSDMDAKVKEEGKVTVTARLFHEIINKFPEGDINISTEENNQLSLSCGFSKASLAYTNGDDYPEFPEVSKDYSITLKENNLRKMINQTIFSSAIAEDKPILTGALFEAEEGCLKIVALDGYRLALRNQNIENFDRTVQTVIPAKSLRETSRILTDSEDEVNLYLGEKCVLFASGKTEIYTRILEGDFVKYKNILPSENKTRVKVDTELLCQAIERASILSREENNNLIKISIKEDMLIITANSEIGKAYEEIQIEQEGKELDIAFNAKYLTDVLKTIEESEVFMDFNSNISPCVIRPVENDDFLYLVLPVQIRG